MSVSFRSSTYPAQFVFCGTAFRGKRAPKALKKYFGIDMVPFELPPLLSDTSSRRWAHYKEPASEAESSNDVSILPSARFLASGEETNNAPWITWGADVVVVCVFLEDRVTTEKRLQQVGVPFPKIDSLVHGTHTLTLPEFTTILATSSAFKNCRCRLPITTGAVR